MQTQYSDRIKLPITFDASRLLADVQQMPLKPYIYYDVLPLRSPAHIVDPSLPVPPPAEDYADGSWTEWLDTGLLKGAPALSELVAYFRQHCFVTLVRLLRLEPGAEVKEHTDPTLGMHIEKSVVRLTIPIQSEEDVVFYLNHSQVPMRPGECWYMRLTDPHSIEHKGKLERINLTIDMVPNDWLESMLSKEVA